MTNLRTALFMQSSLQAKQNTWLILVLAFWTFTGLVDTSESANKIISLNLSGAHLEKILIIKSAEVQLSNDSQATLYDLTIIQVASGRKMLSVEDLKPNASLNLAFDRAGTYIACYSENGLKELNKSTCLQIDVVGLRSI